jgi:hypothetical protein
MKLRGNQYCPIHRLLSCCGREPVRKGIRVRRLGVQRIEETPIREVWAARGETTIPTIFRQCTSGVNGEKESTRSIRDCCLPYLSRAI